MSLVASLSIATTASAAKYAGIVVDAKTGKELWSFNVGTGIVAPPVSWEQDGEQMIAVTAGWGGAVPLWGGDVAKRVNYLEQGGSVWVFKLHK